MISSIAGLRLLLEEVFLRLEGLDFSQPEKCKTTLQDITTVKPALLEIVHKLEEEELSLLKELDAVQQKLRAGPVQTPRIETPQEQPSVMSAQRQKDRGEASVIAEQNHALRLLTEQNLWLLGALDADNYKGSRNSEIGGSYTQEDPALRNAANRVISRILEKSEAICAKLIKKPK